VTFFPQDRCVHVNPDLLRFGKNTYDPYLGGRLVGGCTVPAPPIGNPRNASQLVIVMKGSNDSKESMIQSMGADTMHFVSVRRLGEYDLFILRSKAGAAGDEFYPLPVSHPPNLAFTLV
jgi:hypothetical protein